MTESEANRQWSQDELRAHVAALGILAYDGEVLPQGVKYLAKPEPLAEADIRWANEIIAKHKENPCPITKTERLRKLAT